MFFYFFWIEIKQGSLWLLLLISGEHKTVVSVIIEWAAWYLSCINDCATRWGCSLTFWKIDSEKPSSCFTSGLIAIMSARTLRCSLSAIKVSPSKIIWVSLSRSENAGSQKSWVGILRLRAIKYLSLNGRCCEPAGYWVGRTQCGKKSKIKEVFCGFACYTSEK